MRKNIIQWVNRSVGIDAQHVYRSTEPFDSSSLPSVYATISVEDTRFEDTDITEPVYYYLVGNELEGRFTYSDLIKIDRSEYAGSTGPGPSELLGFYGNDLGPGTHKGFFGEVSSEELISGDALASMIGLTAGTSQHSDAGWLKYFIDGRVLYVAKRNFRHSISWNAIQAVNAVYGGRVVTLGDYQFKIGLLTGADADPATYTGSGHNQSGTRQSEWTRLMYNVAKDLPSWPKAGQIGDNWAEYDQSDVAGGLNINTGNGRYSWCQEKMAPNANNRVFRGGSVTSSGFYASSDVLGTLGWRPRLELVTS